MESEVKSEMPVNTLFFHSLFNLSLAKEGNVQRLPCTHEGTYADDCLVQRVTAVSSGLL